ncbi:hypothetical protein B0A48_13594 [Cryoendolithus antarcticus]|uniref:Amino acid permease/ SLC12A domain-containing protein n=1 Tax=Cryoendolithus antarcticus TaxID=1507870 RepID=A0A1V8SP17_9PEZI|nr:hypothetical protein B0A48_13594 [Cryoendolithus antarcticus]
MALPSKNEDYATARMTDEFSSDAASSLDAKQSNHADVRDMARMGKPQEMQRNFKFFTMFGFTAILTASWEGILSTAALGLGNGGSAGLLYTNLATWIGFIAVYASLGEQGSMAPTSGGQYHWVSEFAPRKYQKVLSYIVGWLGLLGWQVGVAFSAFLAGTQIQGLLVLNYESYGYERWHGTLLMIAVLSFSVLCNIVLAQKLHLVEGVALTLHILGFFCVVIPVWVLSEKAPSKEVWTTFYDPGWGNQGLSCLIGIVASVAPLLGADAAAHMAEELQDAAYVLPRIMVIGVVFNGLLMFITCIMICYCIGDLETVLTTPTGYPFIAIFYNATQSFAATNTLTAIIIILCILSNITIMAGSSRQLFAFARDGGVPFSRWVSHVSPRLEVPVNAILVICIVGIIISLINIGSTVAFNVVTSLGTGTLTISYIVCLSCVAWRRLTGQPLLPSRFDMGRTLGLIVNLVALGWLWLVFIIAFFPGVPLPLLTTLSMNWSVLVFGVVAIFSGVYFAIWGRKNYAGPVEYVRKLD